MRVLWVVSFLFGCPDPDPAPKGKDTGEAETGPNASGLWTGSCNQIGGVELDLTDGDGAITGTLTETTATTSEMVVDGTRTDAALTLEVTYVDSDEVLGTFDLTLDGDTLEGEYSYPGEDDGYACSFGR